MAIVQIDEPSISSNAHSERITERSTHKSCVHDRHQLSDVDAQHVDEIAAQITPTIEEVADWHFTDIKLRSDWDTPLMKVLRFFVDPGPDSNDERDVINLNDKAQPSVAA